MLALMLIALAAGGSCLEQDGWGARERLAPASLHATLAARLHSQVVTRCSEGVESATLWWTESASGTDPARASKPPFRRRILHPARAPGELLGVLELLEPAIDARGQAIRPGTYTLRYVVQPLFKEHLGTAEFADFALLLPSARDDGSGKGPQALIAASRALGEFDHPLVLEMTGASLDPARALEAPDPKPGFGLRLVMRPTP